MALGGWDQRVVVSFAVCSTAYALIPPNLIPPRECARQRVTAGANVQLRCIRGRKTGARKGGRDRLQTGRSAPIIPRRGIHESSRGAWRLRPFEAVNGK